MKIKCEICKDDFLFNESHHIKSKCYGGSDSSYNKADICPKCHELVHRGYYIIEGRFDTGIGDRLVWRKKGENSISGFPDPKVYIKGSK
jgi:hypothetical protein